MHETPNKYACYSQVSFSNLKKENKLSFYKLLVLLSFNQADTTICLSMY